VWSVRIHHQRASDRDLASEVTDDLCGPAGGFGGEVDSLLKGFGPIVVVICEVVADVASEGEAKDLRARVDSDRGDPTRPCERVQLDHQVLLWNPARQDAPLAVWVPSHQTGHQGGEIGSIHNGE
jgi:hypothetical protein